MIVASEVSKSFQSEVLGSVSLRVGEGELCCLLGAGGAGKSTLIRILLGLIAPSSGRASINGIDCTGDPLAVRKLAAYLPDHLAFCEEFTPRQNVRYHLGLAGVPQGRTREIDDALRDVSLPDSAFSRPSRLLTPEQRQGMGLAVAQLRNVPALLADDPTAGLDPSATGRIIELLRTMKERGTAILLATRDPYLAHFADTVAILRRGHIVTHRQVSYFPAEELDRIYHQPFTSQR
jgi:ABC-2 type transport system ATP-binding protein